MYTNVYEYYEYFDIWPKSSSVKNILLVSLQ